MATGSRICAALGHPERRPEALRHYSFIFRDVFVGALVAVGFLLMLYRGFSTRENVALNLAGALVVGVALVPTQYAGEAGRGGVTLHGALAVGFFLAIAYVALFRADDTLSLVRDTERAKRFRAWYRILGGAMVVSPAIAIALSLLLQRGGAKIFFLEAIAAWVFALFWLAKSWELYQTDAERLALEGRVQAATPAPQTKQAPGRLVQVVPTFQQEAVRAMPEEAFATVGRSSADWHEEA